MKCPKCKGLMVQEHFIDVFTVRFEDRCLCCGNICCQPLRHIVATEMRAAKMARWSH
jgi:hypothetical protein